jgi:hypothetical protein
MAYGTRFRMVFSGLRRTRCPRHVSGRMPAVARSFDTTATVRVDASWRSPRQFCNLHTRWPVSAKCMRFARRVVRILAKGVQRPQGEREVRGQAMTECPSGYSVLRTTTGWFAISMPYCPRSRPWRISALLLVGFTMVWLFATRVSADSQATGPSAWPSHMVPAICGPCTAPPQWANRSRSGESTVMVAIDRLRIATGILACPAVVPRGRWFTHAVAPASARGGYLHWVLKLSVRLQL